MTMETSHIHDTIHSTSAATEWASGGGGVELEEIIEFATTLHWLKVPCFNDSCSLSAHVSA